MAEPTSVDGASDLGKAADTIYAQLRIEGEHHAHMAPSVRKQVIAAVRYRASRDTLTVSVQTHLPIGPQRSAYDRLDRSSPTKFTLHRNGRPVAPDAHLKPPPPPPFDFERYDAEYLADLRGRMQPHLTFEPTDDELRKVCGSALAGQVMWDDDEAVLELARVLETNHAKEQAQ